MLAVLGKERGIQSKNFCDWKVFNKHRFHHVNEVPAKKSAEHLFAASNMCPDTESDQISYGVEESEQNSLSDWSNSADDAWRKMEKDEADEFVSHLQEDNNL